jgi:nucleotide-binding universal stress UspA family protein
VVALAEELDADLVIVGGRTRSPAGKAVFGSTAQEILLESPCPVTFVRG